jgi:CheY-like chemotaxis protein
MAIASPGAERQTMDNPAVFSVVLIDDDPHDIALLHNAVARASLPIALTSFTSPQKALQYLRSGAQVHLVISDLEMPQVTGVDLLRQLKGDPDLQALPVVLMSGSAEMRLPQRYLEGVPCLAKADSWHGYQRLVRDLHATLVLHAAAPAATPAGMPAT